MSGVLWMPLVLFVMALVALFLSATALHMSHRLGWSHRCPTLGAGLSIGYLILLPDLLLSAYSHQIAAAPKYFVWFGVAAGSLTMVIMTTRSYLEKTKIISDYRQRRARADGDRRHHGRRNYDSFV
jgi:heme exporter protein D